MYNEKRKEQMMRYMSEKLKEIRFRVSKDEYEKIQIAAHSMGYEHLRPFLLDAIREKIQTWKDAGSPYMAGARAAQGMYDAENTQSMDDAPKL